MMQTRNTPKRPDEFLRRLPALLLALCLAGLPALPAHADKVYVYRNAEGRMWFTDHPVAPKRYRLEAVKYYGRPPAWRSCMGLHDSDLAKRAQHYMPMIERIASQHGVAAQLVRAVISVESCFDPKAVSSVGARGLMQLMPSTAKHFGIVDLFNPKANLEAGVRYLAQLIKRYNGNLHLALAAYNAGPGAVRKYGGVPPYPETRNFVRRVLAGYHS
ncbi:MAG: lytic transglycosylase domain-containing protein [Acidihalobacter sp.]|jgi:soluble lytic murein transglycosylase-like protein